MKVLNYDSDATKKLLDIYVTPDVQQQRRSILDNVEIASGSTVLDVGSGPGFLCNDIYDLVKPNGVVYGIDISEPLLDFAKKEFGKKEGIEFKFGSATKIPFESNKFDVVLTTQVLEYIPDVDVALNEIYRVLKPGGSVVVLDTDWDSIVWHSSDRNEMEKILKAWEEHAAHPLLPRVLISKLKNVGFSLKHKSIIPLYNPKFNEETYSNRLIDLIASFVSTTKKMPDSEIQKWVKDLRNLGKKDQYFFSLNRYLFIGRK